MPNELMNSGHSALTALSNISDALATAANVLEIKGGGAFINFRKGVWMANGDDEIDDKDVWALNPFTMIHGFTDFGDGEVQEKSVPITEPPLAAASLPPAFEESENGWQKMVGVELTGVGGDFDGETFMYKVHSYGGRKAVSDYLTHLRQKIAIKDQNVIALIGLSSSSYEHKIKKYGTIHNPVFIYRDWSTMDEAGVREAAGGAAPVQEPEEAPAPVLGNSKVEETDKVIPDAENAGTGEAPRRRRRRRS